MVAHSKECCSRTRIEEQHEVGTGSSGNLLSHSKDIAATQCLAAGLFEQMFGSSDGGGGASEAFGIGKLSIMEANSGCCGI